MYALSPLVDDSEGREARACLPSCNLCKDGVEYLGLKVERIVVRNHPGNKKNSPPSMPWSRTLPGIGHGVWEILS